MVEPESVEFKQSFHLYKMTKTKKMFAEENSFARKILSTQGWSEGQGLGKSNQGITEALRPHLKFDTSGMGHDPAKEFTDHWWSDNFNTKSKNLNILIDEDAAAKSKSEESVPAKKTSSQKYNGFVKSGTLQGGEMIKEERELTDKPTTTKTLAVPEISDEDLFRACSGLTAHKGARHGITMKAKLSRVEEMERELIKKMKRRQKRKKQLSSN